MIKLDEVGAFVTSSAGDPIEVRFGIYLPGINPENYEVIVRVIHKNDRFDPAISTMDFPLNVVPTITGYNLWQIIVTIPLQPGTHFGQPGTYLYRYQLRQKTLDGSLFPILTQWFTDPFARITDIGELSAFVAPEAPEFEWGDDAWKVPDLENLVVYELQVEEFNSTFDGVIERLTYLKGLGVTCLELMPVTSQKLDFDWGYGPLHYFAPNERWGGVPGLKRLINACHMNGIAVILDVVYQHVDPSFPYKLVYENAHISSPMIDGDGDFGPKIDFNQSFAYEYVQAVNQHWLDDYHVDGFRYDEVTDLYDGAVGKQYARIAYDTYNASLTIKRFTLSGGASSGEYSRIIQCPESLGLTPEVLRNTYSNCAWQNGLLDKAEYMAQSNSVDEAFVRLLDVNFNNKYPAVKMVHDIANNPIPMPVAPFQYLESHDHSNLIAFVAPTPSDEPFAHRDRFFKLQPFSIALYTCQGIPMLWQGQEIAQNYVLPGSGDLRIRFLREVNWEYFYDDFGNPLVRLYRTLGALRAAYAALRCREPNSFYYYDTISRPADGIVVYRRQSASPRQIAMVFLNFSDQPQSIAIPFPEPGAYREMVDNKYRSAPLDIVVGDDQPINVTVTPNYGCIFIKEG